MHRTVVEKAARTTRGLLLSHVSRLAAAAASCRWLMPLVKMLAGGGGVVVLAIIGSSSLTAGASMPAMWGVAGAVLRAAHASVPMRPTHSAMADPAAGARAGPAHLGEGTRAPSAEHPRTRATPEDPVVLNEATIEDFQRLPGIGPKKARAIFDLRAKIGRFRHVEDLLRVKGIGRNTLRKLRILVRLDADARPSIPRDGARADAPG